jgi:hypothetical protein
MGDELSSGPEFVKEAIKQAELSSIPQSGTLYRK